MPSAHNTVSGKPTRIFVSFCTQNYQVADAARYLMKALESQGFDVYTYERPSQNIAVGSNIEHECQRQLEQADFCIAVICDAALESFWTLTELEHAQSLQRSGYLLYINLSQAKPWPSSLQSLRTHRALLEMGSHDAIQHDFGDRVARAFCLSQGFYYTVPNEDPRVPIKDKIKAELFGVTGCKDDGKIAHMDRLFDWCDEFDRHYRASNYKAASKHLKQIIGRMEDELDVDRAYYPRVMHLVLMLERAFAENRNAVVPKVINKCEKIIRRVPDKVDANVFGALGNAHMRTHQFAQAYDSFVTAESLLDQVDPAVIHNKAVAAVALNDSEKLRAIDSQLAAYSNGGAFRTPGNFERIQLVQGMVKSQLGDTLTAVDILHSQTLQYPSNLDLFQQFVDELYDRIKSERRADGALSIYQSLAANIDKFDIDQHRSVACLCQRQAYVALDLGLFKEAQRAITQALSNQEHHNSVAFLVDAALIYHASGRNKLAKRYAEKALSVSDFATQPRDLSKNDFNLSRGCAAWLLQKDEVAQFCFSNAGEEHYDLSHLDWVSRRKLNQGGNPFLGLNWPARLFAKKESSNSA